MSCLKGIKSIGGYVSTPVDKVEYTGIDYINPAGKVISTVIIDQDKRTIAVDVKELSSVPVSLLEPQPLSTANDDYILLCTVNNGSRSYEWISYGDLLNRITADEESIKELRENLIEEINRAKSIEEEINDNLTKEISRATKAEEDLNDRIDNLDYSSDILAPTETISQITQTDGKILVTKQSIQIGINQVINLTDEFSKVRNEFGEADNQLNISLSQKIAEEQSRAEGKEAELSNSINNEKERAENAENTLTSSLNAHIANKENPHEVTKAQIGLENVDNTSDKDKPISTATQSSLDNLKLYIDNLIKSMGELKGTLEEGTLIIGPGEQK